MSSLSRVKNIHTPQIYLPVDDMSTSGTTTPTDEDIEHRWSDIVPPKAALTFAALWDPDEGMITFSGARLLESDSCPDITAHSSLYCDDDSLGSPYGRGAESQGEDTVPLANLHDAFRTFLYRVPSRSLRYRQQRTPVSRASSTVGTRDTNRRDIPLRSARSLQIPRQSRVDVSPPHSVKASPMSSVYFRARGNRTPEMYTLGEHSVTEKHGYLTSRFSTTTTSTSTYVDVARGLRRRTTHPSPGLAAANEKVSTPPQSPPSSPRRRLRKRRPASDGHITVRTEAIMESPKTSSEGRSPFSLLSRSPTKRTLSPPSSPSKSGSIKHKIRGLPRRMSLRRNRLPDEGWVYVELRTSILQRYVPDLVDDLDKA
ncbi:hypothetical protein ID866_3224 [Astraeus odoratus]|nr:hypothetical protein ID866_3224 [Astraeus odoratus]